MKGEREDMEGDQREILSSELAHERGSRLSQYCLPKATLLISHRNWD